ncbi:hypothetical protein CRUP_030670 [Coryphaenoides rupestris]|nr:hypothetical protein CRUP_030670 [Coryphaenoides rupestris]
MAVVVLMTNVSPPRLHPPHAVPSSRKLPADAQPRYLEEEGLYVGERPPVSPSNENILENRVLKQEEVTRHALESDDGKRWFGDDGRILALPNPIKESSTRPPLFLLEEELDPALHTVYCKAVMSQHAMLRGAGPAAGGPQGDYQLDVDVSGLIFSHHPLFSREHVLTARLAQRYDQHLTRQHSNLATHLTDKLNGLRSALRHMLEVHGAEETLTPAMQHRISEYKLEVRNTRLLRDRELEKDRTLLRNIVKLWKEIKALRELQRFSNTPYKLYLRKEEVDRDWDERQYEAEVLVEVMEQETESNELYQKKLADYRNKLEEWKAWRRQQKAKQQKKKKKKKKKRRKKKGGASQDDTEDDEEDEEDDDGEQEVSETEGEEGPPKPEAPERPALEALEEQVREKASRIRRKPGEPILIPELSVRRELTPIRPGDASVLPDQVDAMAFYLTRLARLPDRRFYLTRAELVRREEVARRSLFVKVLYNDKEVGMRQLDVVSCIGASGLGDMKRIGEWATESRLDPNDPQNTAIMQLLKVASSGEVTAPEYFRLEQLQEEFNFATDEELEASRRFRLLRLRSQEVAEFRNYRCVPALEREVTDKTFQEYERRLKEGDTIDTREHLDSHRALVAKYLQKIRESVLNRFLVAKHHYLLSDLVLEEEVPSIG